MSRLMVVVKLVFEIPANASELYEMLIHTPNLCGKFSLVNAYEIKWNLYKDFVVSIGIAKADTCVMIERKLWGIIPYVFTHWHSDTSEIYSEICDIGLRGNVLMIQKNFLGEAVLYAGPEADCPYSPSRKWIGGKIHCLKAE